MQGMKVPPKSGLVPQQDNIARCNTAVCLHPFLHGDSLFQFLYESILIKEIAGGNHIFLANGTYYLSGEFEESRDFCINRLPVAYNPDAPEPAQWLKFVSQLLHEDDIPTLQEYMGYCLIPSNKGQQMLFLVGKGGEGKSRVGLVMRALLGDNMCNGSIQKVETNPFARADLEHLLAMVDDDMKLEALPQTNYIKTIVTAEQPLDLEKKVQELDDLQHMVEMLQQTMDAIPEEIVAQYRTEEKGKNAYSHQK